MWRYRDSAAAFRRTRRAAAASRLDAALPCAASRRRSRNPAGVGQGRWPEPDRVAQRPRQRAGRRPRRRSRDPIVSTASTGNAAAALAGMGASMDMQTIIFVPAAAPEAKIAQLLVYGATVLLVEASYDVAFDLCYEMCLSEGWYCRNTGINPYTVEGKKTVAYEIAEQIGLGRAGRGDGQRRRWQHHRRRLQRLLRPARTGLDRSRIPRLIGVQAEGSSPLVQAWQTGMDARDMQPVEATHHRRQHLRRAAARPFAGAARRARNQRRVDRRDGRRNYRQHPAFGAADRGVRRTGGGGGLRRGATCCKIGVDYTR